MAVIKTGNPDPEKRLSDIRPPKKRSALATPKVIPQAPNLAQAKIVAPAEPQGQFVSMPRPPIAPKAKLPINRSAVGRETSSPQAPSYMPPAEQARQIERLDRSVNDFFERKSPSTADKIKKEIPAAVVPRTSKGSQADDENEVQATIERSRGRFSLKTWFWIGGVTGAMIAIGFILSTTFARAFINVRPTTENLMLPPVSLKVLSSAESIDTGKGILPGEYIEFSDTRSFDGRGSEKKVVNTKAKGTILISNGFGSDPQALVANTRFQSVDGKIFRLVSGVTVPGAKVQNSKLVASTIEAAVIADQTGPAYNIGPSDFTIPGFSGTTKFKAFTGKSTAAMLGGFSGETTVATKADIQRVTESATASMVSDLKDSLSKEHKPPPGLTVLSGASQVEITDVKAPDPNSPGETFAVTVSGKVRAMAFKITDAEKLIAALFSTSTEKVFLDSKSALECTAVQLDLAKKQLIYAVGGSIALGTKIDPDTIAGNIGGKSSKEIMNYLDQLPGLEAYKMKFFPIWLWKSPSDFQKIKVTVEPFEFSNTPGFCE